LTLKRNTCYLRLSIGHYFIGDLKPQTTIQLFAPFVLTLRLCVKGFSRKGAKKKDQGRKAGKKF
jgi:hypothetical protein